MANIKEDKAAGLLDGCQLVVFPVDRGMGEVYKARYRKDICPALTCHNRYLCVVSLGDLDALYDDKAFFRFLHPRGRLQLQGFPESIYDNLPTDACAIKAAGNA